MFYGCTKIISLKLDNFKTMNVCSMSFMFKGCESLISLDLSNFNTTKTANMPYMFYRCINLTSLNLSNFDTSETKNMSNMFDGCSSLRTLDLSNFNTSHVKDISNMFYACSNFEYVNLKNSNIKSDVNAFDVFSLTFQNLMVCTQNDNEILKNLLGKKIIFYCDDNLLNNYNCYMKNFTLDNNYICDICQNNFTFKYNDPNNNLYNSYINCFEQKIVCFNSCKTCEIEGNETLNNCLKCKDEFIYEINITNSKYKNCYSHYINEDELVSDISINTNILIENMTEKIQNIINNIINEFNYTDIENGKDKKIVENEKVIIFPSIF